MSSFTEDQINESEWQQAFDLGRQEQEFAGDIWLSSPKQKELFKAKVKDRILNGELPAMEFYRLRKITSDCLEELGKDKEIYDCAYDEIAKYGKGEKPTSNGSVITTGSNKRYIYKTCGDPVWNKLSDQLKEREEFLKKVPKEGLIVTDPETGETVTVMPPEFTESNFIKVQL